MSSRPIGNGAQGKVKWYWGGGEMSQQKQRRRGSGLVAMTQTYVATVR
jgi:hypothetical protein